ncbi:uncharacterized protein LOC131029036 [Cryptomeria japonica]|uniref:uncharacterized protein LOC131029036 n=1 Tax=Cryptomeria japonica TaxID=3369 RepID=UPI0027DA3F2D|nr:uncharacterized protein LOC131029036 [Cryptomeria japonica]XP_057815412.2 uncharacterized protein LOC131029036 [Cryptomeria japonica]XP_057815413.2 uncharacterized protein LOC131029036 [Cryptomeria japonica]XP_057815414.2 uncharacterized protein LOC131029036 [Cryptomeria japonica]
MGNALLQCVKQCSHGDPAIKVMKMDGQILKYEGPMYAEEILCNYPNDAIFHSDSFHRFGGRCRPLWDNTELKAGELYYLIPHPPAKSREFLESSSSETQNQTHHKRCLPRSLSGFRDKKPSIEIIPSPSQDGVVRLKLLISKKELATLMSESTDAMTMVESIVTPLLTEMEAGNPPKASYFSSPAVARSGGGGYSWKPELESIPEINVTLSS